MQFEREDSGVGLEIGVDGKDRPIAGEGQGQKGRRIFGVFGDEEAVLDWEASMSGTESRNETAKAAATEFEGVSPILRVGDLAASIEYYERVLGFKVDWQYEDIIASVSRDSCHIFLCEGDQGNPGSWVWIGVGDAEALFEEYKSTGAKIRNPPGNFPWAYEMQVEDLDGNVMRMGSEPKAGGTPGKWRDMHGDLWERTPEGESRRANRRD